MPIIIDKLEHIYDEKAPTAFAALNSVDMTIEDNEFVGIIGHTGSGKSTLIQHLNGLLEATSGSVTVNGIKVGEKKSELKNVRRTVGMVFQYPEHQLFADTVKKDIAFGPDKLGLSSEEVEQRVAEAMELVGLGKEIAERSPFELSGGQKRRVAIAGVLAMRPSVLVLDEPVAGLDPKGREELLELILNYKETYKATIIMISHNMDDIARVATKIAVMSKGKLAYYGTPIEIFSHAEELLEMGLGIPQATEISVDMRNKGVNIPVCLSIAELAEEILKLRRK